MRPAELLTPARRVLRAVTPALLVGLIMAGTTTFVGRAAVEGWGSGPFDDATTSLPRPLDLLGYALLWAGPVALVFRRSNPPLVLAATIAPVLVYGASDYPGGPVFLAVLIALMTAVLAGHRRATYTIVGVGLVVQVVVMVLRSGGDPQVWAGAAGLTAWVAAVVGACEVRRARRERRAQEVAVAEEAARRRGSDERLRIAQELHDVLGHHVSLINVQAGVALYLMDDDPEQARAALTTIKASSKELLQEMRATLGVLRGVDTPPPHHPTPGLSQLPRLAEDARAAGLPVELDVDPGVEVELSTGVDLAAYRIIQEALTNTRRHAGPATARVRLRRTPEALTVQIDDDGWGVDGGPGGPGPEPGGGNGLPGMRERARALGGSLETGPGPGGGFRVTAVLPVASGSGTRPGGAADPAAVVPGDGTAVNRAHPTEEAQP